MSPNYFLSEDQNAIAEMARDFADTKIAPFALEWDENKHFPVETLREAASLGLSAIYTSEDFGGSGLSRMDAVLIFEALATGCPTISAFLSIHNMCCWMIDSFGTPEQRAAYLPDMVTMAKIASYCLTEPGAGSDAGALKTKAVREGDHYIVNGSKQFISGAGTSEVYIVMVRTGEDGPKGISTLIIDKNTPGLSFGANEKKMGWNAQPTRAVNFDNVRVPVANRLGAEGQGFKIAMSGLNGGRLNIGACSLGGAQSALDKSIAYLKERKGFGKKLIDFQALQFRIAEMAADLEGARLLLHRAAQALDAKVPEATRLCAMAKLKATDTGFDVANKALQLLGGYGYLADYGVEKIVRDLRVHQILEGTNEIMRLIIARSLIED